MDTREMGSFWFPIPRAQDKLSSRVAWKTLEVLLESRRVADSSMKTRRSELSTQQQTLEHEKSSRGLVNVLYILHKYVYTYCKESLSLCVSDLRIRDVFDKSGNYPLTKSFLAFLKILFFSSPISSICFISSTHTN